MSDRSSAEIQHPGNAHFEVAYNQIHNRYAGITDFRGKLLGLLPLATGTGTFLLLQRAQNETADLRRFLGPIGIFGLIVTVGLFLYELRGMQRCNELEKQGKALELQMNLDGLGPFQGLPERWFHNMLGAPAAGLIVYIATAVAWLALAVYGVISSGPMTWVFLAGSLLTFVLVLWVAWRRLRRWLDPGASTTPSS